MKVIQSAGGPLIGLDRDDAHLWTGVVGKRFIDASSPFATDYEAAGNLVDGRGKPPCDIARLSGSIADGLLISMPMETAVIAIENYSVYIAQVHYADPNWSFKSIKLENYDAVVPSMKEYIYFRKNPCTFVFFDAAYPYEEVGDDFISFPLTGGDYEFSAGPYYPDQETLLTLCRIRKI